MDTSPLPSPALIRKASRRPRKHPLLPFLDPPMLLCLCLHSRCCCCCRRCLLKRLKEAMRQAAHMEAALNNVEPLLLSADRRARDAERIR